jgi:hypothetical protein
MGIIAENPEWVEEIFALDLHSPALGGPGGPLNTAAQQLTSRTGYLKQFADEVAEAREGETSLKARIQKRGTGAVSTRNGLSSSSGSISWIYCGT